MAFNVATLEDYVAQNNLPLLKTASLGSMTQKLINIQTGVKHTSALNILAVSPTLQAGSCGFTDGGSATFSQREITVGDIKVNMSFCLNDIEAKWMNYLAKNSAGSESIPFEKEILDALALSIAEKNEKAIWQGDTTSLNTDLKHFDGLIKILVADSDDVTIGVADSVYTAIKKVYLAIPANVLPKAAIFVGLDTYRSLVNDLVAANLYHFQPSDNLGGMLLPGTATMVYPVAGLNGTKKIVAADPLNLFFGVDFTNDTETFDFFYSKDNQEFRFVCKYKLGTQVALPDEAVYATHN